MTVVDIRNFFTSRNIEIIDADNDYLYYAEEKNQEGHNNLFIIEYSMATKKERVITNYSLDDPTFIQHIFSVDDTITIVLENGGSYVWMVKIDKFSGREIFRTQINCIGRFAYCIPLNKSNFIIYTVSTEDVSIIFNQYKKLTNVNFISYLYDSDKDKKYFIKNPTICKFLPSNIKTFDSSGGRQILFLDPYGDERIKENCFKESKWIGRDIRDNIWVYPVSEFIENIKLGMEDFKLSNVASADINGMVRFIGMNRDNIYFKIKQFSTQMEQICGYNKDSGSITPLKSVPPLEDGETYCIDKNSAKMFKVKHENDIIKINGVLNSNASVSYEDRLGDFIDCIEDRFIITSQSMTDGEEKYEYECINIYDSQLKTEESFECKCFINDNTLVLY